MKKSNDMLSWEERYAKAIREMENFESSTENWRDYQLKKWLEVSSKYDLDNKGMSKIQKKHKCEECYDHYDESDDSEEEYYEKLRKESDERFKNVSYYRFNDDGTLRNPPKEPKKGPKKVIKKTRIVPKRKVNRNKK